MASNNSSQTAAAVLASFCTTIRWDELPQDVRDRTVEFLLDHLGVTLRGSVEASSKPAYDFVQGMQSGGDATVIGAGFSSTAAWAAMANGIAAHAIEMDDVTNESSLHPAVAVMPAALAVAEEQSSNASDLLGAIVAGYEVMLRVGNALNPPSTYQRGFHPTGVAGAFGAVTAAGYLLGLSADTLTHALGITGTMASGSMEYLTDGAWTKRLNAGWAAHAGVVAANLARAGFSGPPTVFDGPFGLLRGYTDEPHTHRLVADLGDPFQISTTCIKPYGCCRYIHGLIDCMFTLRKEHEITPEQVEKIRLVVLEAGLNLVAQPGEQKRAPQNVVDAQFSAQFSSALALAHGAADVNQFTQENIDDAALRDLTSRVECYNNPDFDKLYPLQWPAAAEIELRDGRKVATQVDHPTGDPRNPVPRDGLVKKFVLLTDGILESDEADDLAQRILNLDSEPKIDGVMSAIRRTEPAAAGAL